MENVWGGAVGLFAIFTYSEEGVLGGRCRLESGTGCKSARTSLKNGLSNYCERNTGRLQSL